MDKRNYRSVGIVIDTDTTEDSNPFCSTCAALGVISKLKQRLYLDDKGKLLIPQPADADNWLQCWVCNVTIPIREAKMLGTISGIQGIEPVNNPSDFSKGKILGIDSGLSNRIRRLKRQREKHPDKDVQAELDKGNIVTNYQTSMPT